MWLCAEIDPRYGTNADLTNLVSELHKRGMKLLLDLASPAWNFGTDRIELMNTVFQVVNHTSDQAPQFIESAAAAPGSTSEEGSKRDWYIWKKGTVNEHGERVPPNNWGAAFGGVSWPTSG